MDTFVNDLKNAIHVHSNGNTTPDDWDDAQIDSAIDDIENLTNLLQNALDAGKLNGKFLDNSRTYDNALCDASEFLIRDNGRYWDAKIDGIQAPIEIKKCKVSGMRGCMWFNALRFAESYLEVNENASTYTITVVIMYSNKMGNSKVAKILIIPTHRIIEYIFKTFTKLDVQNLIDTSEKFPSMSQKHYQISLSCDIMSSLSIDWLTPSMN